MQPAKDISKYQGAWSDTGEPIYMIKMSGGDAGLYLDPDAATNYNQSVAHGKAVGGYHFAGGTDPVAEANYFMNAMAPKANNDVYALDWEVSNSDPVGWCNAFVTHVHDTIGVWPLIYMNLSTLNAYNWTPVLANCGLWLADWNGDPNGTVNTSHTYVMQQYSDGPNYDHDSWFGTIDEFKAYGWHAPPPAPAPAPTPEPTPTPTPTPPIPVPPPEPEPTPKPKPSPTPPQSSGTPPSEPPERVGLWQAFLNFLKEIF